jgi:teichuronic acid biosynthesis glycosyltransferase TuaC
MRILVVTSLWPGEGTYSGRQVQSLCESLAATQGALVDVHLLHGRGDSKFFTGMMGVRAAVRRTRPDVVLAVYGPSVIACSLVRTVPKVVYLLGSDVNRRQVCQVVSLFTGRSTLPVFVSDSLRCRWPHPDRGLVIPNGVDRQVFRPGSRTSARARLGFPATGARVMFGGVRSVATKNSRRFDAVLELVRGSAPDAQPLELTGNQSTGEVAGLIQCADVLLLTSNQGTEGSPTIVKEALACGVPVVTVDVGDVNRWVCAENGAVIPWSAEDTLVRRLAKAVIARLSPAVDHPPYAPKEFDSEAVAQRFRDVLQGRLR